MLDNIDDDNDNNEVDKPEEESAHLIWHVHKWNKIRKSSDVTNTLWATTDNPQNGYNKIEKPLVSKMFIPHIRLYFLFLPAWYICKLLENYNDHLFANL